MTEYEYCMICAAKYKEKGNIKMYEKYYIYAMHIGKNTGWGNDKN